MKKLLLILLMLVSFTAHAQVNGQYAKPRFKYVTALPATCVPNQALIYVVLGALPLHYHVCTNTNTFVDITGGGSGATINATNGVIPYRLNSTTFSDSPISTNANLGTGLGVTSAAAGSGVTLGVTGTGDNNLNLATTGTGSIEWGVNFNGVQRLRLTNSNASSSAFAVINVAADSTGAFGAFFANSSTNTAYSGVSSFNMVNARNFPLGLGTNDTIRLLIANDGNIGIGTATTTAARLTVLARTSTESTLDAQAASGAAASQPVLRVKDGTGAVVWQVQADGTFMPFGAVASSLFPALKAVAGSLHVRRADDGNYASLFASEFFPGGSVVLGSSGTGILTVKNTTATNAATAYVFGTYTDASNYVHASLAASSTAVTLAAETAGTGADNVPINLLPAGISGVVIGSGGTGITKHLSATATLNFANQAAVGCEVLTITVTGAAVGDTVAIGVPDAANTTNSVFWGWVSATDTVSVKHCAVVSGDPASGSFRVDVWKH